MGKPTGFLEINRALPPKRSPQERINDYKEIDKHHLPEHTVKQASRCMDCGIPFCHHGCPLGNNIPEFNDAVYNQNWRQAYEILISTNNFPEFTGRICPAPCETSCVLGIHKPAVAIEHIEKSIIEKAFDDGIVKPTIPSTRTGRKVAVVGSGPAGLAVASQLNAAGHTITVFERADEVGGLLRYGIPDFKLDKKVVERRVRLMEVEGITFITNANVGGMVPVQQLRDDFDAIVLCGGATVPRDLPIPGRNLKGVEFAMDFLTQQNRRVSGKPVAEIDILANGKHVVVIGGGDTGSDCVGTSNRQGAATVSQIEILPKPPIERTDSMPWPNWPMILRTSTSHEEGCQRQWCIVTKEFIGNAKGEVTGLKIVEVEWKPGEGGNTSTFVEVAGSERILPCDLALLSMGFLHPQQQGLLDQLGVQLDARGNVKCTNYRTSVDGVFCAGDMRRGQSLVVWAISEGREAARVVDEFLMGFSALPSKEKGILSLI